MGTQTLRPDPPLTSKHFSWADGTDDLVHGFGGGYLPPVVPAPGRPVPAPDFTLAAGMTIVVQPNVTTRDGRAGVQTGELLLVTEDRPQRLHAFPPGLHQAG